jgi:hypothetical protein
MAYAFHHSTPATGAEAYYNFKELLVAQGWTVLSSGDSLTYFPASDGITHGGAGAGGLANTKAWFRIQDPAAAKEFTFQRGTTNVIYRIKFSPSGGFVGGAPSATVTPLAVIEAIVKGGGTDAAPTYAAVLGADGGVYRFNCAADNAAPYAFWATSFPTGGGVVNGALIFEGLSDTAPGEVEDTAILAGTSLSKSTIAGESISFFAFYPTAGVPATWQSYSGLVYYTLAGPAEVIPSSIVVNPITGKDEIFPILLMRRSAIANPGYKGRLAMTKWAGPVRVTGDTLSAAGARDYIVQSDVILPWDGSVPAV